MEDIWDLAPVFIDKGPSTKVVAGKIFTLYSMTPTVKMEMLPEIRVIDQ
jgi:hypothetical protein